MEAGSKHADISRETASDKRNQKASCTGINWISAAYGGPYDLYARGAELEHPFKKGIPKWPKKLENTYLPY